MKRRSLLALLGTALLIAAAAGCNGDGELTLEAYFQEVDSIFKQGDERLEPQVEALNQEFSSEDEQVRAIRDFWNANLPNFRDSVDALEVINAPPEVAKEHNKFIEVSTELEESFLDISERLEDVESIFEVNELLNDPGLNEASDRSDEACLTLQDIADANNIEVNLECVEEDT
ncbi:hypothetical protein LCGC14_2987140 [marine sediment metagenome]|uniref:Imelysin-like domain-containing protein n=1 Tax=marine sediment metagenome TaxID=412755 RepID=A0A0F8X4W2_9ZZZZ